MRITVLFQIVPDITKAAESDWSRDPLCPLTGTLPRIPDAFDESALELALRLRDSRRMCEEETSLCGITFGGEDGDRLFYQRLFALGFHQITRIDGKVSYYDPRAKVRLLANAAQHSDLVLCGTKSGLGGSGMTGFLVAELLGIPAIPDVSSIESFSNDPLLQISSESNGLHRILRAPVPLVLMVGNTENARLRVPSLRARMSAASQQITTLPASVFSCPAPQSVARPTRHRHCHYIEAMPDEAACFLHNWLSKSDNEHVSTTSSPASLPDDLVLYGSDNASIQAAACRSLQSNSPLINNVLRLENGSLICSLFAGAAEATYVPDQEIIGVLDRRSKLIPTEATPAFTENPAISEELVVYKGEAKTLSSAPRVLIAGYGLGSAANCTRAQSLATRLDLAFGATRSVVMNGWSRLSTQVGVSGSLLSASRCLVLGASGAEAFLAALPEHCHIAAVNTDPHAPIFRAAEIGFVGDAQEVLRVLEERIEQEDS